MKKVTFLTDLLWRRGFHFLVYLFFYAAVGVLVAFMSKYILREEAVKRAVASIVSPINGYLLYDTRARDNITVFALDDRDLREYRTTYPAPYRFHAQRLRNIASHGPRAIFIDFWFPDERDDPDVVQLADDICRIRESGVHVYLASLSYLGKDFALRSVIRDLKNRMVEVPGGGMAPCAVEVSVAKQVDSIDRVSWEYELVSLVPEGIDADPLPTAAAHIYNDLYSGGRPLAREEPLALLWGSEPHPLNGGWMVDRRTGKPLCRGDWYWMAAIPGASPVGRFFYPTLALPPCPYHLVLPLRALREFNQDDHPWGVSLDDLIAGKIVLYGGNLQSVQDLVYSPVHGRLPGLLMHAMALDNLIIRGDAYPAAGDFDIARPFEKPTSTMPLVAILLLSLIASARRVVLKDEPLRTAVNWHFPRLAWIIGVQTDDCANAAAGLPASFAFLVRFVARGLFALVFLVLVAMIAAWWRVGLLTWIEFAVLPMLIGLLKYGEKVVDCLDKRLLSE